MKTTVVPAQVTTVEDKIMGNVSVSQLLLMTIPIFGGSLLYVMLPPFFSYAVYKVVLVVCIAVLCCALAVRVKGNILLHWAVILLRYNLRPMHYVPNKNDVHLRGIVRSEQQEVIPEEVQVPILPVAPHIPLTAADLINVEKILASPDANMRLKVNAKGELSVHISEIQ